MEHISKAIGEIRAQLERLEKAVRAHEEAEAEPKKNLNGADVLVVQAPSAASKVEDVPLPAALNTNDFQALFREFIRHRRAKDPKDHFTAIAAHRKLTQLAKLGLIEATRWVEFALDNGLKNIQEPFERGSPPGTPLKPQARPRLCAQCGVQLERTSYPSPRGDICPLCRGRS